jgi:hypothetical protein
MSAEELETVSFDKTELLESYRRLLRDPLFTKKLIETHDPKPAGETPVFVVSHSRVMQCGIDTLDYQNRLGTNLFGKEEFNFQQNIWTLQLKISDSSLYLYDVFNGVKKPKKNEAGNPGTIVTEDRECVSYDQHHKTISSGLRSVAKWATSSTIGEDKYTAESDDEDDHEPRDKSFFRKIKKRKDKNYPPALKFDAALKYTIYITRHANSCNNISEWYQYHRKSKDPSLSMFGITSLSPLTNPNQRPAQINELAKERRAQNKNVYVSCCIRTWQTAILIYGNEPGTYTLRLYISPYIKEEGIDEGNLPQTLDLQLRKITDWILNHQASRDLLKDCSIEIYMSFVDTSKPDQQIYPVLENPQPVYEPQHLTYYPDGILFFSKWVIDHIQSLPEKINSSVSSSGPATLGGNIERMNQKSRKKQYKKKHRSSSRHK